MGLACYVAVEGDEEAATRMDGKALAAALDKLEDLALREGLRPLHAFIGLEPGDPGLEFLSDAGVLGADLPASAFSNWFPPAEGIEAFRALIAAVRRSGNGLSGELAPGEADVIRDLEEGVAILSDAAASNRRWHLALDL